MKIKNILVILILVTTTMNIYSQNMKKTYQKAVLSELKRTKEQKIRDDKIKEKENKEEEEIIEEGEIMELANPEDEQEENSEE